MSTQWKGLLANLGEWIGTFAVFSSEGHWLNETPSCLTLSLSPTSQVIDLELRRFPENQPETSVKLQFSYPGPGPTISFFEQGAFSQGAIQHSGFAQFGAELSMIWGVDQALDFDHRRLRLVPIYSDGIHFSRVTLICESFSGESRTLPLTPQALCGKWQGTANTLFADGRESQEYELSLTVGQQDNQLHQHLQFLGKSIESSGQITPHSIDFSMGPQPLRLLLLPGGGSVLCPISIQRNVPFFLEAGWLMDANTRQRLIRSYNKNGEWVSLTLIQEHKVTEGKSD